MSLFISSLNSGSNGNCYYIGNGNEAVLIDAGLSCREIEKRMSVSGLSMSHVKAVFITHEHTDHIKGVEVLSRKHRIPIYITPQTMRSGRLDLDPSLVKDFSGKQEINVGGLTVFPFRKVHDAADPFSFVVGGNGVNIGVFTDMGVVCKELVRHFSYCHAAFLEANYDEQMLQTGPYPYHLKKRISGGRGHLSNAQALNLFSEYKTPALQHLILSHLSRENNSPELVRAFFEAHAGDVRISVASRFGASEVFHIVPNGAPVYRQFRRVSASQLSLF